MNTFEKAQLEFQRMIDEYGWAAHYVPLDKEHINYHTHGVMENFGHPDFQIVIPLSQHTAHGIMNSLIADIKKGKVFVSGNEYDGFLNGGFKLRMETFTECGRPVLRVLFPDMTHKMPHDPECDPSFKKQLDYLDGDE